MKRFHKATIAFMAVLALVGFNTAEAASTTPPKIGVVNFKEVVEKSKIGKHEQQTFEAMREQMEKIIGEKEKAINEVGSKLQDEDYLDGLTPDAENELKHQYRVAAQELQQIQSQFMQTLQQANFKVVQNISDKVSKASAEVAKKQGLDIIVNNESVFYQNPNHDISALIVEEMDRQFDEEQKNPKKDAA
jgi:outer membrane protein